jgi:hypothetical protein
MAAIPTDLAGWKLYFLDAIDEARTAPMSEQDLTTAPIRGDELRALRRLKRVRNAAPALGAPASVCETTLT